MGLHLEILLPGSAGEGGTSEAVTDRRAGNTDAGDSKRPSSAKARAAFSRESGTKRYQLQSYFLPWRCFQLGRRRHRRCSCR